MNVGLSVSFARVKDGEGLLNHLVGDPCGRHLFRIRGTGTDDRIVFHELIIEDGVERSEEFAFIIPDSVLNPGSNTGFGGIKGLGEKELKEWLCPMIKTGRFVRSSLILSFRRI